MFLQCVSTVIIVYIIISPLNSYLYIHWILLLYSTKYFINMDNEKATIKHITYLRLADNSVTEDEQAMRQMTLDYNITLFTAEPVVYDNIDVLTGLPSINETDRIHLEKETFD